MIREERFVFYRLDPERRRELIEILVKEILMNVRDVLLIVIFGSFVSASMFRDVDVGIYLGSIPSDYLELEWNLGDYLSKAIGYPVDVKILNYAPPSIRYSILRKGIVVYERYRGLAERIATASKKEAIDIEIKRRNSL